MTTATLKKKIKVLLDQTSNEDKLNRVLGVLANETKEDTTQRLLQEVVDASDRSLKASKGVDLDEFDRRTAPNLARASTHVCFPLL